MKVVRLGCFYMSAKVTELFHKQLNQNTYLLVCMSMRRNSESLFQGSASFSSWIPLKKIALPPNLTGAFPHNQHKASFTDNPVAQNVMEAIAHRTVIGCKTFVCLKLSPSPTCSASKHYSMSMATGKKCVLQVQKGPEVAAECL